MQGSGVQVCWVWGFGFKATAQGLMAGLGLGLA